MMRSIDFICNALKGGSMRLKITLVIVPILLLITLLVFIPFKQTLVFTYENEEKLLAYLPFEKENSFQIKYTHSIHLSDVIETYKLTKKQIILTELSYKDFAIGMPSNAEGDEVFEEKNGTYYIKITSLDT